MILAGPPVRFVSAVGVAPSTTTMTIPSGPPTPAPPRRTQARPVQHPTSRYYMPYASFEDLRSSQLAGLGIINESDAWLTGRPYGLPGTAAIRLNQVPGGYSSPNGYHYNASMLGGNSCGFGDADTVAQTAVLQQIADSQRAQQKAMERTAFWQALLGGITVGALVIGAVGTIIHISRRDY